MTKFLVSVPVTVTFEVEAPHESGAILKARSGYNLVRDDGSDWIYATDDIDFHWSEADAEEIG